jgi:L-seryl-tRNA(Ser) seleniumtransferase
MPVSDLRRLPAVHSLIADPRLADAAGQYGHAMLVEAAREALEDARGELRGAASGDTLPAPANPGDRSPRGSAPDARDLDRADSAHPADPADPARTDALVEAVLARLADWLDPRPRPVINATGVIIHTNLGRAPVSPAAADAMRRAMAGYSDLEYVLAEGRRGSRHALLEPLLCRLTGAEAALVVNNNAGATLLVLSALAIGRGVLVSRGQLVEIGGGYRIPDVMAAGGARLVEVGTTNRTRIGDYRAAIDETTALILRVHTSNYRIIGFTAEAALSELVALGREHDLPVVDDLGSGSLIDTMQFGLAAEPLVPASLAEGAALAAFSGDKLLGGPQAGVIVGRADLVAQLRKHPLTRAMRPGKDTIAGLHATLLHYAHGEALDAVPVWRMIAAPAPELRRRATRWRTALARRGVVSRLTPGHSTVGGGSLPGETLPTTLLALDSQHPDALAAALRGADPPVVARIEGGAVVLDPRTVLPGEDEGLLRAVVTVNQAT